MTFCLVGYFKQPDTRLDSNAVIVYDNTQAEGYGKVVINSNAEISR